MNKKNPLIYIVMPIYNGERFFLQQLMSIYQQNYSNWHLIVVNDGSTDNSMEILKKFSRDYGITKKITIINKENGGCNAAVQTGLEYVQNNCSKNENILISLCDADDIWMTNKLSEQVKIFIENPNCDLVYCDLVGIDANNNITTTSIKKTRRHKFIDPDNDTFFKNCLGTRIVATGIIFKYKYIEKVLPIPNFWYHDFRIIFVVSAFKEKNIVQIKKQLGFYRGYNGSETTKKKEKNIYEIFQIYTELLKILKKKSDNTLIPFFINYFSDRIKWRNKPKVTQYFYILIKYPKIMFFFIKSYIKYIYYKYNKKE